MSLLTNFLNPHRVSIEEHPDNNPDHSALLDVEEGGIHSPTVLRDMIRITCPYGWRRHPVTGQRQFHQGVDLRTRYGLSMLADIYLNIDIYSVSHDRAEDDSIYAIESGRVVEVRYFDPTSPKINPYIKIQTESGRIWKYVHPSSIRSGRAFEAGEKIGESLVNTGNSSGLHLHLEQWENGHPVDPEPFLREHFYIADLDTTNRAVQMLNARTDYRSLLHL